MAPGGSSDRRGQEAESGQVEALQDSHWAERADTSVNALGSADPTPPLRHRWAPCQSPSPPSLASPSAASAPGVRCQPRAVAWWALAGRGGPACPRGASAGTPCKPGVTEQHLAFPQGSACEDEGWGLEPASGQDGMASHPSCHPTQLLDTALARSSGKVVGSPIPVYP